MVVRLREENCLSERVWKMAVVAEAEEEEAVEMVAGVEEGEETLGAGVCMVIFIEC